MRNRLETKLFRELRVKGDGAIVAECLPVCAERWRRYYPLATRPAPGRITNESRS